MAALVIAPYRGWRPYGMRVGRNNHEGDRGTKRSRLGNSRDRALYRTCKNPSNARYVELCEKADDLNGIRR